MKKLLSITSALLASTLASAADLSTIYEQAASNDPEVASARASREADDYNVMIARGALLPQAQLNYNISKINSEAESIDFTTGQLVDANKNYTLNKLELAASMSLFNYLWLVWLLPT